MMTLAKLIEQLLQQEKSGTVSVQDCFISLLDVSVRLKEVQEGREEEEAGESENDEDGDSDFEDDDDDEVWYSSFFIYISHLLVVLCIAHQHILRLGPVFSLCMCVVNYGLRSV